MQTSRLISNGIVALMVVAFVAVLLPATFPAARHSAAINAFEPDAATLVLPPLLDIYAGRIPPNFSVYGHFPAYCAAFLALPVLGPMKLLHGSIDYFYFVMAMRWAQLGMAALAVIFVYRIGTLAMPRPVAVLPAALLLTMTDFYRWTLALHPDIFQTAMLVVAVFYLVRSQQNSSWRDLGLSALAAGFSTASKYYGVFILPAVGLSLLSGRIVGFRLVPGALRAILLRAAFYALIVTAVFVLINLRMFLSPGDVRAHLDQYKTLVAPPSDLWHMLRAKIANFVSPNIFGSGVFVLYLASLTAMIASDARRWFRGDFVLHPYQVIHATFGAFALYYLPFFSTVFTLYFGERYVLPFLCLLPIPAVYLLCRMIADPAPRLAPLLRPTGVALAGLLLALQVLRVWGTPLDYYQPVPRLLQSMTFDAVIGVSAPPDRELILSAYERTSPFHLLRLKQGLGADQLRQLTTFWQQRSSLLNYPATCREILVHHLLREEWASLRCRQWVIDNVPRGNAAIYADWGTDLAPTTASHILYADNEDLPTKNIHCSPALDFSTIATLRPDYIFTGSVERSREIVARCPEYTIVACLQSHNEVMILKRNSAPK